jgi:two-component system response regulator YesN
MVVDDSNNDRKLLCKLLSAAGGIEIAQAANAAQALENYPEFKPHVFIIDVRMPGMDGLELWSKIRSANTTSEAIIITGYDSHDTAAQAAELGAQSYLPKPIQPQILLSNINSAMTKVIEKSCREEYRKRKTD